MKGQPRTAGYAREYSEEGFWSKVLYFAKPRSREVIETAFWLYFANLKDDVPAWAKAVMIGALGYFIFPMDAIPDATPVVGYADDLGVLDAAAASVAIFIDNDVNAAAKKQLKKLFG